MRHIILSFAVSTCLVFPAAAQEAENEPPSLMERGVQMFLEGLLQEMEPALDDLQGLADEMEPAFREFSEKMGPMMTDLFGKMTDIMKERRTEKRATKEKQPKSHFG